MHHKSNPARHDDAPRETAVDEPAPAPSASTSSCGRGRSCRGHFDPRPQGALLHLQPARALPSGRTRPRGPEAGRRARQSSDQAQEGRQPLSRRRAVRLAVRHSPRLAQDDRARRGRTRAGVGLSHAGRHRRAGRPRHRPPRLPGAGARGHRSLRAAVRPARASRAERRARCSAISTSCCRRKSRATRTSCCCSAACAPRSASRSSC